MSRLFITPREIQFINDIGKEFTKDVVGQYIYYYPVSTMKTQIHRIYDEAVEKIFENPIKIDVLAGQPERSTENNAFGLSRTTILEVMIQARDLIDKQVKIAAGDFFIYGNETYEIQGVVEVGNIYGQEEYGIGFTITAMLARAGQLDIPSFKQLLEDSKNFDSAEVQKHFQQQRGFKETSLEGNTGDFRQMRDRLKEDMAPIALGEGPRSVEEEEEEKSSTFTHDTNSLYGDF